MFGLIRKTVISAMKFFIFNILNVNSLEYFSRNNQECKIKPEIIILALMNPCFIFIILK